MTSVTFDCGGRGQASTCRFGSENPSLWSTFWIWGQGWALFCPHLGPDSTLVCPFSRQSCREDMHICKRSELGQGKWFSACSYARFFMTDMSAQTSNRSFLKLSYDKQFIVHNSQFTIHNSTILSASCFCRTLELYFTSLTRSFLPGTPLVVVKMWTLGILLWPIQKSECSPDLYLPKYLSWSSEWGRLMAAPWSRRGKRISRKLWPSPFVSTSESYTHCWQDHLDLIINWMLLCKCDRCSSYLSSYFLPWLGRTFPFRAMPAGTVLFLLTLGSHYPALQT